MHIYLRLIRETGGESYSDAETREIRECVSAAPGVQKVKQISRHHKGGYAVTVEAAKESVDALIEHVSSRGFRLVI